MKFSFALVFILCSVNCQFVAASNPTAADKAAQSLYSQIKHVESEIMRVWVTIDALVDEITQSPDAITEDMHKSLADLYFYDCELGVYLDELEIELSRRDDPSSTVFTKSQSEPIISTSAIYRIPADAFPVLDGSKIVIK